MKNVLVGFIFFLSFQSIAQTELFSDKNTYTRQDSLRGSITPERSWWDLKKYEMQVSVFPDEKFISGKNIIIYEVLETNTRMQIDLQEPMKIVNVTQDNESLKFERDGNVYYVELVKEQEKGEENEVVVVFEGYPREAKMAPWDGGFSWTKDQNGNHFIATSNQGIGASLWWPCKDHMYDEPENGVELKLNVPKGLVAVGNGRLVKTKKEKNKTTSYTWRVINPINNYGVNINVGDYVNIKSKYEGLKGPLDVDFWVLRENEEKAKVQFKEAYRTLEAFEYWFGPYPFYEDSYKLVEVPYLGMEHQSSVTYGNQYRNGYNGRGRAMFDWSGTGWGEKFDFIIVHESGHEWFANSITNKDIADMWIHEGFTSYSESLFLEYFYGKEAAFEYSRGLRRNIYNQKTLIGDYDVNKEGPSDIYFKGHNLLHTIRQIINDDNKWRAILIGLNKEFYHQTVTTDQIEQYISAQSAIDFTDVFDQYLRDIRVPVFEYIVREDALYYRWTNCIESFDMPINIEIDGNLETLSPTTAFQPFKGKVENVAVDPNFYVYTFQIN